jgi:acylphosphatase
MPARRFVVRGVVQGVGFRHAMKREAQRLGLSGWVRNRANGSVEAVAVGDDDALDALHHWARRGPPSAHVDGVEESRLSRLDLTALQPPVGSDFRQVESSWD